MKTPNQYYSKRTSVPQIQGNQHSSQSIDKIEIRINRRVLLLKIDLKMLIMQKLLHSSNILKIKSNHPLILHSVIASKIIRMRKL